MHVHKIKKGYNLPIKGEPRQEIIDAQPSSVAGIHPVEFKGVKGRMLVKEGDSVKIGTPLIQDKKHSTVTYASPASGKVSEVILGYRRVIEKITITIEGEDYEQAKAYKKEEIADFNRDDLINHLLKGSMWNLIRQRPFSRVADETITPSSIFVNCMDTAPLTANPEFQLQGRIEDFKAGIEALKRLAQRVIVITDGSQKDSPFNDVGGTEQHAFTGKHPAGLTSTHISRLDPILGHSKKVWYLNARDAADIGSYLLTGQYPTDRIIALSGPSVKEPLYIRTKKGASLASITAGRLVEDGETRIVNGDVLGGWSADASDYLGHYASTVSALPEGGEQKFIGWMLPGLNRYTFSHTYLSAFLPGKKFNMDTSVNGEERAFVKTGDYERVVALDILPMFLAKAVLVEDIEQMEQLGILECDPEDFALCSYICPSKIEMTEIIRNGLEMMEKEMV